MGKSSINGSFSMAMLNNQMVNWAMDLGACVYPTVPSEPLSMSDIAEHMGVALDWWLQIPINEAAVLD